jgi:hypothetical protein
MSELPRFIRVAKIMVLTAAVLTGAFIIFVVGWQVTTFIEQGSWPSLTISSALELLNQNHGHNYETQSTRSVGHTDTGGLVDVLLSLPVVALLIVAAVVLSAFYVHLARVERLYTSN